MGQPLRWQQFCCHSRHFLRIVCERQICTVLAVYDQHWNIARTKIHLPLFLARSACLYLPAVGGLNTQCCWILANIHLLHKRSALAANGETRLSSSSSPKVCCCRRGCLTCEDRFASPRDTCRAPCSARLVEQALRSRRSSACRCCIASLQLVHAPTLAQVRPRWCCCHASQRRCQKGGSPSPTSCSDKI